MKMSARIAGDVLPASAKTVDKTSTVTSHGVPVEVLFVVDSVTGAEVLD